MKIESIFEGVKFGNTEIQELKKESNKILIGIEYEFLPNNYQSMQSSSNTEEEIGSELGHAYNDYLEELLDRDNLDTMIYDLVFLANMDMEQLDFTKYTNNDVPNTLTTDDLGKLKEDLALIEKLLAGGRDYRLSSSGFNGSREFNGVLDKIKSVIRHYDSDKINFTSFEDGYNYVLDDLKNVITAIEAGEEDVEIDEDSNAFVVTVGNLLDKWELVMDKNRERDIKMTVAKEIWPYDQDTMAEWKFDHSFEDELQIRTEQDPDGESVDLDDIKENMVGYGIDVSKIEKYHLEHDNMVEFITEPMPLLKSIDYMKRMFAFIDANGSTPGFAGMHVNISIKGKSFLKDNFDVLKLFILLDQKFISEGDRYEKFFGFAPRNMVQKVLNPRHIPFSVLLQLAGSKNPEELIKNTKELIDVGKKYQQLNFNHIFSKENTVELHRIEARYFGGEDYHIREKEIEWQIYRLAYMLEIAFNPEFERENYLKKLIKFLDDTSIHHTKISFAELARQVVGGGISNVEDLVQPSDISTRGKDSILIKQQNKARSRESNAAWDNFKGTQK